MEWFHIFIFIVVLVLAYTIGFITKNYLERNNVKVEGLGTIEGSLLGLFAFFLGFTFNISANKVENVRNTSVLEANAIGTALLRTQMYSSAEEAHYKDLFKNYLADRIKYFNETESQTEAKNDINNGNTNANKIWNYTIELQRNKDNTEASRLMIPAVNDMIDAVSTRESAINANLPNMIVYTLYILSICSCFIIGFTMQKKIYTNFIGIIYIFIIALTVNMILDAGNPRDGFINTKKANQLIVDIYNDLNK